MNESEVVSGSDTTLCYRVRGQGRKGNIVGGIPKSGKS